MSAESILIPPAEMDSAWKNILDAYFHEFMTFFYPALADAIDWSTPYDVMDKELQAITKDAMIGKQFVDKLNAGATGGYTNQKKCRRALSNQICTYSTLM